MKLFSKFLITLAILVSAAGMVFGQTVSNAPPSPITNSVVATGPITIIAGNAVDVGLTWIAQHGSAGAEFSGPLKGGKNGGNGPAVTETAWFLDLPWINSNTSTNIDFRLGLLHADVVTKTLTVDQFGIELSESFFNQNLAQAVHKVPVVNVIVKALARWDVEVTESVAGNTDELSGGRFSDEKANWGVGVKIVKLY